MSAPKITLKLATSLDARIALANGVSQWITSAASRARGHELRAQHDAILVGSGTLQADDPLLTARTEPAPLRQPLRMVADSSARTPVQSRLVQSVQLGRVVIVTAGTDSEALRRAGAEIWSCGESSRVDPLRLARRAAEEGIGSILLEGGGALAASFLKAGLIDCIVWFRAPMLIGSEGKPALGGLGLTRLEDASRWRLAATEQMEEDTLETYVRK
jgi:diaminohydroxyphosphoribosylaminopyrimidine deaminase/5-amino-6-(5-phosphoribosylamino)uracil reductase